MDVRAYIPGCCLERHKVVTLNQTFPREKFVLIQGTVYTINGEVLKNAAIVVFRIEKHRDVCKEVYVGITFTLEDGSYGISLPANTNYKFICYP